MRIRIVVVAQRTAMPEQWLFKHLLEGGDTPHSQNQVCVILSAVAKFISERFPWPIKLCKEFQIEL